MNILVYLEEAIHSELNVSDLYRVFSKHSPEDNDFWSRLCEEELSHASLLKAAIQFYQLVDIPFEVSDEDIKVLIDFNKGFESITKEFEKNPSRKYAFDIALQLENSVGEAHYQKFMTSEDKTDYLSKILKKLNKDDINHEARIRDYMLKNNI
jgi:hypothetical protein